MRFNWWGVLTLPNWWVPCYPGTYITGGLVTLKWCTCTDYLLMPRFNLNNSLNEIEDQVEKVRQTDHSHHPYMSVPFLGSIWLGAKERAIGFALRDFAQARVQKCYCLGWSAQCLLRGTVWHSGWGRHQVEARGRWSCLWEEKVSILSRCAKWA